MSLFATELLLVIAIATASPQRVRNKQHALQQVVQPIRNDIEKWSLNVKTH